MPPENEIEEGKGKGTETPTIEINGKQYTAEQIQQTLAYANNKMTEQNTQIQSAQGTISSMEAAHKAAPAARVAATPAPAMKDVEMMSREEFGKHIVGNVVGALQPYINQVQTSIAATDRGKVQDQIEEVAGNHQDFWDWNPEIKSVLKDHPDINIEDAYTLAKTRNDDKASILTEKQEKAETEAEEKKTAEEGPVFGGLLPTSGMSSASNRMEIKDAAESAWQDLGLSEHLAAITDA